MPDEWMVRVEGDEYGPVDAEALREWKAEGRLIPSNEVRRIGQEGWVSARTIENLFDEVPHEQPQGGFGATRVRSWREIGAETWQIYRHGFGRFLLFAILSAVPMFVLQFTMPTLPMPDVSGGGTPTVAWPVVPPICAVALLVFLAVWPISTAGFQFVADDIVHGRQRSFGNQFRAAVARWGSVMGAAFVVYASYFFWFFIPFAALIGLASSGQLSILSVFLFLLISIFMVYMNARLFINFLFWQPAATLRPHGTLSALRESKELARCAPESPKLDRPLYRGAIVASVWLLVVLVLAIGIQVPFMIARFLGAGSAEDAIALAHTLAEAKTADTLTILADIASTVLNLLLQPILAAAFIVLYYDARARAGKSEDEINAD
ncbi:MAG: DUF4339 domain-containing protein [Chthoniobacterales bacterium]